MDTNNVAAQAGDEPMLTLDERRAENEAEAVRINAGRKPKFGDWMRNPWAGESNPQRDGMFVQSKRVTGKFNPGLWYEMTDGEGAFWSSNGKVLFFIVSPHATVDVQRDKEITDLRTWLSYTLRQNEFDMVLTGEERRRVSAVLATTKPGA